MSLRAVKQVLETKPTVEGAGVKLQRAFGFGKTKEFDPFLLLDDFRNENPADYLAGFPWHPHRGIETITYVLAGEVDHGDSLGNRGKLGWGDGQGVDAGRGHPAPGEPARTSQDDETPLPGRSSNGDPGSDRRRRHIRARHLRRVLGQDGPG